MENASEALSAIAVTNFFEEFGDYLADADPQAVELWKWHLAEEYEHREVAHEVYYALFGGSRLFAWAYRVYGFFYATRHIRAHTRRMSDYLLSVDRAQMTAEQLAVSRQREAQVEAATKRRAKEHLMDILSFSYNPVTRPEPQGLQAILTQFA